MNDTATRIWTGLTHLSVYGDKLFHPSASVRRRLSYLSLPTQGFLHLSSVATAAERSDPAALATHPTLQAYAEDLCGIGYRLDLPVRDVVDMRAGRLVGGDSRTRDPAREYFHTAAGYILTEDNQQGFTEGYNEHVHVRQCQGLLAIWALSDIEAGEGFALVACSHLADVEPPVCLNHGHDLVGPLSVITQPAMCGELDHLGGSLYACGLMTATHRCSKRPQRIYC
jgi:hypothetical protein